MKGEGFMIGFTLKKGIVSCILALVLVASAGNGKPLDYDKIHLLDSVLNELPLVFPVVVSAGRSTYSVYKALKHISMINEFHPETVENIVFNSSVHNDAILKLRLAANEASSANNEVENDIRFPDLNDILGDEDDHINATNMDDIERMLVVLLKKSLMERATLFFNAIFGEKYKKYIKPLIDLSIPEDRQKNSLLYKSFILNGSKGRIHFERNIRTLADLSSVCYDLLTFIKDLFDSLPQALSAHLPEHKEEETKGQGE
jgi:hypothetical protein